ncbi:MAG: PilW family protein [Candidatus Xenobia bacterium]
MRGYTLLELLMAVAIGSVLMTAAVLLMRASLQLETWVSAHAEVESEGQNAVRLLAEELRGSAPSTFSMVQHGLQWLSFRPVDNLSQTTSPMFAPLGHFVVYYFTPSPQQGQEGTWSRKIWGDVAGDRLTGPLPTALDQTLITEIMLDDNHTTRVLSRWVHQVTITPETAPPMLQPPLWPLQPIPDPPPALQSVRVNLTLRYDFDTTRYFEADFSATTALRNAP